MPSTLVKALLALLPAGMLLAGAAALLARRRTGASLLQLVGAACLVVVVLSHFAEGTSLFPGMGWGRTNSIGHYLDLGSAVLGVILFPLGYLLEALGKTRRA